MRIIGGHDYYDSAQAFGFDPTVVLVRDGREVRADTFPVRTVELRGLLNVVRRIGERCTFGDNVYSDWRFSTRSSAYQVHFYTVIFAGERYGAAKIEASCPAEYCPPQFYYSYAGFIGALADIGFEVINRRLWSATTKDALRSHFEAELSDVELQWLIENRVSIAVVENKERHTKVEPVWRIDCCGLGDLGFAKVLPPYEASQELSMWVGGTMPRAGNPAVEIQDDLVKAGKHGFDEWSFRKKAER